MHLVQGVGIWIGAELVRAATRPAARRVTLSAEVRSIVKLDELMGEGRGGNPMPLDAVLASCKSG